MLKAKTEEDERKTRALLFEQHYNKCAYLRLDPHNTPLFPQYPEYYFDVNTIQWTPMPEPHPRVEVKWEFPRMAALPLEAFTEEDPPVEDPAFYYPPGMYGTLLSSLTWVKASPVSQNRMQ